MIRYSTEGRDDTARHHHVVSIGANTARRVRVGADGLELMKEYGFSDADIAKLKDEKALLFPASAA